MLNILGGESTEVTPGRSRIFGRQRRVRHLAGAARAGARDAASATVPVYNNVREGLDDGHRFNCGVVYLPPPAARDGVAELIRVNPDVEKIFIVTEKMSVHDAREIRAMAQHNGVDVFGANSLGVADAWNRVRIGGALGGDNPAETLKKGSIAILSNSGNFGSTIATYLRDGGLGHDARSSRAARTSTSTTRRPNSPSRSRTTRGARRRCCTSSPAAITSSTRNFTKPVVACVVGRWKSKLTRAVGHAGAMAGGNDDALAKERWFMEKFGVDGIYTPEQPIYSARGAVVTNIAHIAAALTAVMRENAARPDFEPEGSTALKPWFGSNQGLELPPELDIPVVEAIPPYNAQIAELASRSARSTRVRRMKDASGASQMDPKTQVTHLHGVSMLNAAQYAARVESRARAPARNRRRERSRARQRGRRRRRQPPWRSGARRGGSRARGGQCAQHRTGGGVQHHRARPCPARPARGAGADRALLQAGLADACDDEFDVGSDRRPTLVRASFSCAIAAIRKARRHARRAAGRGAKSVFVRYLESLGGPSDTGCGAWRRSRRPWRGPARAPAHLARDGVEPAVVDATHRNADRCFGAGRAARAGALLRRAGDELLHGWTTHRDRGSVAPRPQARAGASVRVADAARTAPHQRARDDIGARARKARSRRTGPRARSACS